MRPLPQPTDERVSIQPMTLAHAPILETRALHWPDEAACANFAARVAQAPALHNAYIELHGGLGAGKTTFVRHLLRALGISGRVKSPTYAVVEPYQIGEFEISHFDFYRFNDPREWEDAGFRDIFGRPGLKLAEWPELAAALLPQADLRLSIEVNADESRAVTATAFTPAGRALLE
jgi:tRNA threonylcarbamoyladenosine biosynthesis protein TsaE